MLSAGISKAKPLIEKTAEKAGLNQPSSGGGNSPADAVVARHAENKQPELTGETSTEAKPVLSVSTQSSGLGSTTGNFFENNGIELPWQKSAKESEENQKATLEGIGDVGNYGGDNPTQPAPVLPTVTTPQTEQATVTPQPLPEPSAGEEWAEGNPAYDQAMTELIDNMANVPGFEGFDGSESSIQDLLTPVPKPVAYEVQTAMQMLPQSVRQSDMAPYYEQSIGRAMMMAASRGAQNMTLAGQAASLATADHLKTLDTMRENGSIAYGQQYLASVSQRQNSYSEEVRAIYSADGLNAQQEEAAIKIAADRYRADLDLLAHQYENSPLWDDTWWPGRASAPSGYGYEGTPMGGGG